MQSEYQIVKQVYAAKENILAADDLIRSYIPYIRTEVSKFLSRMCTEQDDEFSIGMIAFHEAIRGYEKERGAFLKYASVLIRSRLMDYQRKEARHRDSLSLNEESGDDGSTLMEILVDKRNHIEESISLEATRKEIEELSKVMAEFGVSFSDIADNSPKQERTLKACRSVVQYAIENTQLLYELLKTKKLPIAQLVLGSGTERKTIERHRKYILVMLLIQTNGYEIIREHLRYVLKTKGDKSV